MQRQNTRRGILVLGCGIGLASGFAGLYFSTLAIFLKPIAASFGWTRADTSTAIIMSMLGLAIGAPLQGLMIDRIGALRIIFGSVLCFSAALFGFGWLPANHLLFATVSFAMGLLTVSTGPNGYLSLLPHYFDRRLGLALSSGMVGVGLSAAAFPAFAQMMIEAHGWREAYRILAVVALAGGVVAWLLIGNAEQGLPPIASTKGTGGAGVLLTAAARDLRFWMILVALMLGGAGGLGAAIHLAAMLGDRGVTPSHVALAVGLSGVGLTIGRFAAGALMDAIHAPWIGAGAYLLGALGLSIVGLGLTTNMALLGLGALLVGLALGAEGDFAAFVVRRYFGTRSYAAIYGTFFGAYSLGGVAGPILFGVGFDRNGNYVIVTGIAISSFAIAAALVAALGPYRFHATTG